MVHHSTPNRQLEFMVTHNLIKSQMCACFMKFQRFVISEHYKCFPAGGTVHSLWLLCFLKATKSMKGLFSSFPHRVSLDLAFIRCLHFLKQTRTKYIHLIKKLAFQLLKCMGSYLWSGWNHFMHCQVDFLWIWN